MAFFLYLKKLLLVLVKNIEMTSHIKIIEMMGNLETYKSTKALIVIDNIKS